MPEHMLMCFHPGVKRAELPPQALRSRSHWQLFPQASPNKILLPFRQKKPLKGAPPPASIARTTLLPKLLVPPCNRAPSDRTKLSALLFPNTLGGTSAPACPTTVAGSPHCPPSPPIALPPYVSTGRPHRKRSGHSAAMHYARSACAVDDGSEGVGCPPPSLRTTE